MIPECLTMSYSDATLKDSPRMQRKKNDNKEDFGSKESVV